MERLSIDEIIQYCSKEMKRYENKNTKEQLESGPLNQYYRRYWESRQTKEYLELIKSLREYFPVFPGEVFWELNTEPIIPYYYKRTAHTWGHCEYAKKGWGVRAFATEDDVKRKWSEIITPHQRKILERLTECVQELGVREDEFN